MKRALFVSAGTVAGLVASLSYSPALLQALGAQTDGKHTGAGDKAPRAAAVADRGAKHDAKRSGPDGNGSGSSANHNEQQTKKTRQGAKTGSAARSTADAGSGGGDGTAGSTPTSGSGSGTGSGSGSSTKPTHTDKPKPSSKPTPAPEPHSYTGSVASTAFGPVQVSITVLDGKITDATAIQYPNADPKSVEIANKALPKLRSETLAAQSAQIATVTGASYTSKGWITSLQSALTKAGL